MEPVYSRADGLPKSLQSMVGSEKNISKGIHVVTVWDTAVAHEDHDLVDGLGVLGKVIPEVGGVVCTCQVGGRLTLLGVDEVWGLRWVPQEEGRCVVSHQTPVSFIGLELHREG
jgi:hypothetical protein